MDEKKMTQEEKDFIDKFVETAQNGAKKLGKGVEGLSKTALKTAAMAAMTAGVAIGAMTADLPGMEISEAQAAASIHVQPSKPQPAVRTGNTGGGGYNKPSRPSGNRGGGYSAPRSGGNRGGSYSAPAPQVTVNNKSNYVPSEGQVFRNTLAYNGANLLTGIVTDMFGFNGYGGLLYDHYGYGNHSSWDRRNLQLVRAAESDFRRAYDSGRIVTVSDGVNALQRSLQPLTDGEPVLAGKINQVLNQALENEKKLIAIQKGVDKANEKLDDIGTEQKKQGLTLDEMKQLQLDAQRDAQKYHNETMRAIDDGDKSITDNQVKIAEALNGVSAKVDTISTQVKGISDQMKYYILALIALGVPLAVAMVYGYKKFNVVDKKIDGIDNKVNMIGDTTDSHFRGLEKLFKEVGVVRDTTDATFGKVHGEDGGNPAYKRAYDETKKRLAAEQAEKEKAENEKEI